MYEHIKCMIMHVWMLEMHDWLAVGQRSFTKADETLEDWARSGSCCNIFTGEKTLLERPSLGDVSKPWLRAIKLVKEDPWKVLGYRSPLLGVSVLGKHWMFASVVNAFHIIFIFHFSIPFLPEPPFRVFDSPGINSFDCPIFACIAFMGCQSAGCSFFA